MRDIILSFLTICLISTFAYAQKGEKPDLKDYDSGNKKITEPLPSVNPTPDNNAQCKVNDIEYKTEDGEGCGYKKRTCCYNREWSGWNEPCPKPDCGEDKCWDGYECVDAYIRTPKSFISFYEGYSNGGGNSGPETVGEEDYATIGFKATGKGTDPVYFENEEACSAAVEEKKNEFISKGYKNLPVGGYGYSITLDCNNEKRFNEIEFTIPEGGMQVSFKRRRM